MGPRGTYLKTFFKSFICRALLLNILRGGGGGGICQSDPPPWSVECTTVQDSIPGIDIS